MHRGEGVKGSAQSPLGNSQQPGTRGILREALAHREHLLDRHLDK